MKKLYRRNTRLYWLRIWLLFVSATAARAQTTQTPAIQWQRLFDRPLGSYTRQAISANGDGYAVIYGYDIMRLSESGNTRWISQVPIYPYYRTVPTLIAAAADGGFGVLAYNDSKWLLARLDASGSTLWMKEFVDRTSSSGNNGNRDFTSLLFTADGGFLATAGINYYRAGAYTELYKFDAVGTTTIKTSVSFPGGNNPRPTSTASRVIQTMDGSYLLVGGASGPAFYPAGWIAKLDGQLTVIWQKTTDGRKLDDVIISPYDNSAFIAVGSVTGAETRSLTISANGDVTNGVTLANRANFTTSFLVAGSSPTSHTIADVVNERQGDIRLQTVVGQNLSYLQKLGGSGTETVTGVVAGADGGFLIIGTTTSTDGDIQGKTNTDAEVWLVKVGPVSNSVYSIKSGNWNDPAVWSCGCVPAAWHNVTINDAHTVRLDTTMPAAACLNLEIIGTFSMQGSSITINGSSVTLDETNVATN